MKLATLSTLEIYYTVINLAFENQFCLSFLNKKILKRFDKVLIIGMIVTEAVTHGCSVRKVFLKIS